MVEKEQKILNEQKKKVRDDTHDGHRHRIIQKLEKNVLTDHEYLEVFLFNALPRKNTNDLAHRLLRRFGSVKGVFGAKLDELMTVQGVGESVASYIVCAGMLFKKFFDVQNEIVPLYFDNKTFPSYVQMAYANEQTEVLDFYLFNGEKKIFKRKRFTDQEFSKVTVEPREFFEELLNEKPLGIVAVHNHPNGTCLPSSADDNMTAKVQVGASFENVLFCDHLIYGKDGVYSYYLDGKMKLFSELYSINNITKNGLNLRRDDE